MVIHQKPRNWPNLISDFLGLQLLSSSFLTMFILIWFSEQFLIFSCYSYIISLTIHLVNTSFQNYIILFWIVQCWLQISQPAFYDSIRHGINFPIGHYYLVKYIPNFQDSNVTNFTLIHHYGLNSKDNDMYLINFSNVLLKKTPISTSILRVVLS